MDSAIVPDYSLSTRDIYFATLSHVDGDEATFGSLLSQLLGLAGRDVEIRGRDLYVHFNVFRNPRSLPSTYLPHARVEYRAHPPEKLVLRARLEYWE